MSRRPTKAADNPFCQARLEAAKYNERFYSKEYAAEQLHISAGQLQDYELGITKCIPPDSILRMADAYNAPELRNFYCTEMCPLGCDMPKVDVESLDRIALRALGSFRKIKETRETLLDITADGVITEDEKDDLGKVLENLEELEQITQCLKTWVKKNME